MRGPESVEATRIIGKLREAGFVAYLAGGCVRDALLGRKPKDFDVATDATPEAIREVFGPSRTLAFGAAFGVIGVLPPRRGRRGQQAGAKLEPTEVATFRSDGEYSDGRRPDSVHYGDAKHDALRRDFTINGLFYDPETDSIIDYVNGRADLRERILRTIGDPLARFEEDKLRMLRAVRFATTLGFRMEASTHLAIEQHAHDIHVVSGERIAAEMRRILISPHCVTGLKCLAACGLDHVVLPEMDRVEVDRLERLVDASPPVGFSLALARFCVSLEQPFDALRSISARWRLSKQETRVARSAIKHRSVIARATELPWSTVQGVLVDRDAESIVALAALEAASTNASSDGIRLCQQALRWPREQLDPAPLLSGDDLRSLGIAPGPAYRRILDRVREAQLNHQITTRQQAIEMAKR